MTALTWGAFLPHGGAGEFAGWSGAEAWARLRDAAVAFDELGFDHLWVSDHLLPSGAPPRSGPYFESYATMTALTQVTKRASLGALVTSAFYRNPGLLAKQAAMVDVLSQGRFIFGLGGGWDEPECDAFGIPFPPPAERVTAFAETLEAVLQLWEKETVDYDGSFVRFSGAACNPAPARRPPVWTGTHGPRGLRIAARFADVANWNVAYDDFVRLSGVLDQACASEGRDPASIERSVFRLADVSDGAKGLTKLLEAMGAPPEARQAVADQHFVGPPEQVVPAVQRFVDAGARHIVLLFLDSETSDESAERWLREVVPAVSPPS